MRENQWLKDELDKKYADLNTHYETNYQNDHSRHQQLSGQDDMVLNEIIKRNKYLEEKNY